MAANIQTILVSIIILCALIYVLRRVLMRLRSFGGRTKADESSTCGTGCGKCGGSS